MGKIQVRADAAGGRKAGGIANILQNAEGQFPGCKAVHGQIICDIQKGFIYGVYMNILFGRILQINGINIGGVFNIELHARRCHDVFHIVGDLEYTAAVPDT